MDSVPSEKSELLTCVLEPARKSVKRLAQAKYPHDFKQQSLYQVRLINESLRALKIFLDRQAAEAVCSGSEVAQVGAAIGGSVNQSNVRRKLPHMRTFENAIAEANKQKKPVQVIIDGWNIQVDPNEE